jgi:hypothetical protein
MIEITAAGYDHFRASRLADKRGSQHGDKHDKQRIGRSHRRFPPGDRRAQAQRHRHDLRPGRHPDHRPGAPGAGRRHALHRLPPRTERRQCRRHRRLHHAEAGHLPDRVGAGLPERPDRAGQRHHQLLPDDPDFRLQRARDRRPAAGRLRGDGPAEHRQALRQGLVPDQQGRGHRHRRGACDPRRRVGPSGRRLPRPAGPAAGPDHRSPTASARW